jgi:hypothetical protein
MKKIQENRPKILIVNDNPVQLLRPEKHLNKRVKEVIACLGGERALGIDLVLQKPFVVESILRLAQKGMVLR